MSYIDGMVCAVPTGSKDAYAAYARAVNAIFLENGASACVDNWGDNVPAGEVTDFPKAVRATADETVVLAWVTWPDKATRDAGWEKVMQDPRMGELKMPFDGKRMIYGGFAPLNV
jgi:uncharacterized protein YbaA (DUF1428 family)